MSDETVVYRKTSTGPFELEFIGHTTADDLDKEAGEVGACVEEADQNLILRSELPKFHQAFTPILESLSGEKRAENEKATAKARARAKTPEAAAKVKPVSESFILFANRVKATVSEDKWSEIEEAAKAHAKSTKIDASPSVRVSAVAKGDLAKAEQILSRDDDAIAATVGKLLAVVPDYDLSTDDDGKPEKASLARLIGKWATASLAI